MKRNVTAWGLLAVSLALSTPTVGQDTGSTGRLPVTVALVDELPYPDAPFVILRRPDQNPHDVILLPRTASPVLLSDAVRALMLVREHGGDVPVSARVLRTKPLQTRGSGRAPLPWAARVLQDLRSAPRSVLVGIGEVPQVQVWLPRTQRG